MTAAGPRRIVLDCDPGHDDAMAILLAAASPAVELLAITTVAGNQTLDKTTLNARRVCSVAGITGVPIAAGRDRPLRRDPVVAESIHGASGLDGPAWDSVRVEVDPRDGVDLIAELARGGSMTVVATGPLTNVAAALEREPSLADRLDAVVAMGGAIGLGNWTPSAEFNVFADPEAAQRVLDAGVPFTLVPLEVTHRALATPEVMRRIDARGTAVSRLSVELMAFFQETYRRVFRFPHPPLHDPCAVAAVVDPTIVATQRMHVEVDLGPGPSVGRTLCDVYGMTGRVPNAAVGVDLDVERFWDLMIAALASY